MDDNGSGERQAYCITGRVQGVGFRWWASRTAASLGLSGSIRNRADGSVEVHVAGPADAVETFRRRLEEGPPGARVQEVRVVASDLPVPEGDFRIVR